ncbi:MAG TPA: hypothetical protein PK867_05215 [Pirellulales bacterium]|nr:hypothetical protein [Pirellulales bacterium]
MRAPVRAFALVAATTIAVAVAFGFQALAQVRNESSRPNEKRAAPLERTLPQHHAQPTGQCAAECAACQQACDSCEAHCLDLLSEGNKAHRETLQTCLDCAEICAAADQIVSRGGPFSGLICRACADACARCAAACERFPDDQHMSQCAQECRKCQNACETMLGEGGPSARSATEPTVSKTFQNRTQ